MKIAKQTMAGYYNPVDPAMAYLTLGSRCGTLFEMNPLSFERVWLDALLSGTRTQISLPLSELGHYPIESGALCQIYIELRDPVTEKPVRVLTDVGRIAMSDWVREVSCPKTDAYYAHLLGTVEITKVYDAKITCMDGQNSWATAEGFYNFETADRWFTSRYGTSWMHQTWHVIQWDYYVERYFEPDEVS